MCEMARIKSERESAAGTSLSFGGGGGSYAAVCGAAVPVLLVSFKTRNRPNTIEQHGEVLHSTHL